MLVSRCLWIFLYFQELSYFDVFTVQPILKIKSRSISLHVCLLPECTFKGPRLFK
mgnify:CR=1 FL=1